MIPSNNKVKTVELQSINVAKDKLKIDKAVLISLFDIYFKRTVAEELVKLQELGGFIYLFCLKKY